MSHLTIGAVSIRDLAALETAAKELGGVFVANQKTYRWYGRRVQDTPLPVGVKEADLGKCAHVIKLNGAEYDIGVVQQKDGSFRLMMDYWGPGQKLCQQFGRGKDNLDKLMQSYSRHATINAARKAGYFVRSKTTATGAIKMELVRA